MEKMKILAWLQDNPRGSGDGSSSGYGYGYGDGSGSGSGYGSSSGSGYGSGYGSSSGSGYGSGYGDGYGDGDGSSSGYGYGYGDGSGSGYGSGYGDGYGDGISFFGGYDVFTVDDIATIITGIHGSLAKGYILNGDFTLDPCYIVKGNGYFAHGETAEAANAALREKIFENMNKDEAIQRFCEVFCEDKKYPCLDFYEWHHYLTGSCAMGRKSFMKNHGITEVDTFTVDEFFALTENDFGGDVIRELKLKWSEQHGRDT